MNDLSLYLSRAERDEAYGLSFGAGEFTQNDIRLAELAEIAEQRRGTHMGAPEVSS